MPIHNWKKAPSGLFHHFHQQWTVGLCNALNRGALPADYFALIESKVVGVEPDVMTLQGFGSSRLIDKPGRTGGIALQEAEPKVYYTTQASDEVSYARRANRITVRYADGSLVAVVEFVSPGNKHDRFAIDQFVEKAVEFLQAGVNLLVIDLFPPTRRDPQGIHKVIWDQIEAKRFKLPPGKPLTAASYIGTPALKAYVQPMAVQERLPEMPLYLETDRYIRPPLEEAYNQAWEDFPAPLKKKIPTTA